MSEREHAGVYQPEMFDQGCRRRRPRSSTAAASSVAPIARAPSSAPNRNITAKESAAAGDITIVRPAAAAPPRRPEQVEMRRAGFLGHPPPRDKEHHLASRKCRRESTPEYTSRKCSIRAVGAVDPVAPQRPHRLSLRSPELHRRPRTGISLQRNPPPPATSPSCGQQPLHHPGGPSRSKCAAPDSSATTRQGIKNTISPAGNVGERARRSIPAGNVRSGLSAPSTP